jgi:acetyl/propionyl-CoA carboxylase alpha subunit
MEYKFEIKGKSYKIEIPLISEQKERCVKSGGKKSRIHLFEDKGKINKVMINGKLYSVKLINGKDGYPEKIIIDNRIFPIELKRVDTLLFRPKKENKKGDIIIRAFIPGLIKDVMVAAGQKVKENDLLLILEAMKMENEIRAPKDGIVKDIFIKPNQTVYTKDKLISIG